MATVRRAITRRARRIRPLGGALEYLGARRLYGRPRGGLMPRTFNEKVAYKKAMDRRHYLALTADKLAVRDYVASRVGAGTLTELYAVVDDAADLDFDRLPASFVMKATHGSGWVLPVPDRACLDVESARARAQRWLGKTYGRGSVEPWYRRIPPRIIVEEFIGDPAQGSAPDYKFFVMNGRVVMVQVDRERFTGHVRNLFTPDWQEIPIEYHYPRGSAPPPAPDSLGTMLEVARALSTDTDFVRVDLYEAADRVVFGELTHTPAAGKKRFSDYEFDVWLGSQWQQPVRYRSGRDWTR